MSRNPLSDPPVEKGEGCLLIIGWIFGIAGIAAIVIALVSK